MHAVRGGIVLPERRVSGVAVPDGGRVVAAADLAPSMGDQQSPAPQPIEAGTAQRGLRIDLSRLLGEAGGTLSQLHD